ncbi:MAG: hypothetical protein HRU82_11835 [Nitrospira sp.]|nr:MAG: hypothetical protein HRU82_11835 [Nitrospira sp.]
MKQSKRFDRLAAALRDVSPDRLRDVLVKDTPITFRVTRQERDDMHRVAKACSLTLTDYLIRLHLFASKTLAGKEKE